MKKTLNGTILGVLLVWSIYFFYVTRDHMSETISNGGNASAGFMTFLLSGAVLLILLGLMVKNSTIDKKPNSFLDRMRANTTLSEEDEREKGIAAEVAKKNYTSISNFIVLFMMVLPMFNLGQTFTMHQVLATIAVVVTIESLLFFYRYYKMYTE